MKIFIKIYAFAGGVARSVLEHARVLKERYSVTVYGNMTGDNILEEYESEKISVHQMASFSISNMIRNFRILRQYDRECKQKKPDLLIAHGACEAFFIQYISQKNQIPMATLQAGGKVDVRFVKVLDRNSRFLVFSYENKEDLVRAGFLEENITIFSNRMRVNAKADRADFYFQEIRNITCLMISRIDSDKIHSVFFVIECVDKIAGKEKDIVLKIAGDGACFSTLKEEAARINKRHNREVIVLLGHVRDLHTHIADAHIVFGKGRSVLDAIMSCRVGIIVGEDKKICRCNPDTFEHLFVYNFSGRLIKEGMTEKDILELISQIRNHKLSAPEIKRTAQMAKERYDVDCCKERLEEIYGAYIQAPGPGKPSCLKAGFLFRIARLYFILSYDKMKRRLS